MRIKFIGDLNGLEEGISLISEIYNIELSDDGIIVKIEKSANDIEVSYSEGIGCIKYNKKIHFFRGLGLFIENLNKQKFSLHEEPQFKMTGVMIDSSRNSVLKVQSIKEILTKMALMGLNMLMLYTEDTYELEGEPHFGYLRGRYSYNELKECDDYADVFGIEIIPCIQTLGHLGQVLKWKEYGSIKDNDNVLLVGDEKAYQFIEKMIVTASAPFRSKQIHIGMDEAWGMGLGNYLNINGLHNSFDIITSHLNKVVEITEKNGLKPMIWSDMFFRAGSKKHSYFDLEAEFPKEIIERIPINVRLVYWDYYSKSQDTYSAFLQKHKELCPNPVFAGGILSVSSLFVNYDWTINNANAALNACKEAGIEEVFACMWHDDGAECNDFYGLLGMQVYAEHSYSKELDFDKLKQRTKFCTGIDYDSFIEISTLDEIGPTNHDNRWPPNFSKYLLWQDPLLGLYDKDIEGIDFAKHYEEMEDIIQRHIKNNEDLGYIFRVPYALCSVLRIKSQIGNRMRENYLSQNNEQLKIIAECELPELYRRIEKLRIEHRDLWMKTYKPFGWEVLDLRYGGLLARIDSTTIRLLDYINNKCNRIEELDEERLPLDSNEIGLGVGIWKIYKNISTTSVL